MTGESAMVSAGEVELTPLAMAEKEPLNPGDSSFVADLSWFEVNFVQFDANHNTKVLQRPLATKFGRNVGMYFHLALVGWLVGWLVYIKTFQSPK